MNSDARRPVEQQPPSPRRLPRMQWRLDTMIIVPLFTMAAFAMLRELRDPNAWEPQFEIIRGVMPAVICGSAAGWLLVQRKRKAYESFVVWWFDVTMHSTVLACIIAVCEVIPMEMELRGYRSYSPSWIHPKFWSYLQVYAIFIGLVGSLAVAWGGFTAAGIGGLAWLWRKAFQRYSRG